MTAAQNTLGGCTRASISNGLDLYPGGQMKPHQIRPTGRHGFCLAGAGRGKPVPVRNGFVSSSTVAAARNALRWLPKPMQMRGKS